MNRKTLVTFIGIYALGAGIGYLAWIDRDASTVAKTAEPVSLRIETEAPEALRPETFAGGGAQEPGRLGDE